MSKNIVLCCDGTGNEYGDRNSNVVHLYGALVQDEGQRCYYHPGVGTEGSPSAHNKVQAFFSVMMGLAFGAGLLRYVGDAYRFLMNTYEDGDRIFLFGFSRGAYTARAISGMLHMFGLLYRGNDGLIPYAIKLYARKTRKAAGMKSHFEVAEGFKTTFSRPVTVHLVGVWDTVSSVGVVWDPLKLAYTARNPIMLNGRHAVSIDERRCFFRNNLWGPAYEGQSIKQVWFAGVHSDVGGSYATSESGLSQIALEWMMCEAVSLGLRVDPERAATVLGRRGAPPVGPDPAQKIHVSLTPTWWPLELLPRRTYDEVTKTSKWIIPMGRARQMPEGSVIHESVVQKLGVDPGYRPKNLPAGWERCVEGREFCEFG
jgi:uncharacterized protein (DUF2235 family)